MDEKLKKIEDEKRILLKLLHLNPLKKRDDDLDTALIRRTVNDLAFMRIELDGLQEKLARDGWEDEYINGKDQSGKKQNPAAKTYLDVQRIYNATTRHLKDIANGSGVTTDELLAFINDKP